MILLKNKKSKHFHVDFIENLDAYADGNTNYEIKCPHCNSTNLITHGYYKRTVIYESNNSILSQRITIKRVKCKECNKTHALLPFDIIPYKQVIFSIIINCLYNDDYFNLTFFSFDVRLKWKKQYKLFFPYIKTILNNSSNIYNEIMKNFSGFFEEFYIKTKKILFLLRKSIYNVGFL